MEEKISCHFGQFFLGGGGGVISHNFISNGGKQTFSARLNFRMPDPYDFTADQQCNFEELQTCQFPKVLALKINPVDRGDIWSSAPQLKSDSSTHGVTTQMATVSIVSVNLLSADSHLVCSIAEWVIAREFCWSAKTVNGSVRNII